MNYECDIRGCDKKCPDFSHIVDISLGRKGMTLQDIQFCEEHLKEFEKLSFIRRGDEE